MQSSFCHFNFRWISILVKFGLHMNLFSSTKVLWTPSEECPEGGVVLALQIIECPVLFQDCSLPDSIMKQASIVVHSVTVTTFSLHGHLPGFVNGHAGVVTPIYEMVHQQPVRAVLQQSQFIFMLFHSILCVSLE